MKRNAMLDERAECLFKPITKVKKLEAQSLAEKKCQLREPALCQLYRRTFIRYTDWETITDPAVPTEIPHCSYMTVLSEQFRRFR